MRRLILLIFFLSAAVPRLRGQDAPAQPPTDPDAETSDHPAETRGKLPAGVILVRGAVPSSSDHATPLPEDTAVSSGESGTLFRSRYFGLAYPLPAKWSEEVKGPPPSDSGNYVLAQLTPPRTTEGPKASLLVVAQDLFFGVTQAATAAETVHLTRTHLPDYYSVERGPQPVELGGHSFIRFDYQSKEAGLHWYLLTTQVRCHALQFIFTGHDPELIEQMVRDLAKAKLPDAEATGGGDAPLCIPNYATGANVIKKSEVTLTDRRFNAIPVRIIIDRKGRVRHVHVLSAFPEQAALITDALLGWQFKPLIRDGVAMEVETGLMLGTIHHVKPDTKSAGAE